MLLTSVCNSGFSNISLKDSKEELRITPMGQGPASTLAKSEVEGFGYLPLTTRYFPHSDKNIYELLVPTTEEKLHNAPLFRIYGEKEELMCRGETEAGGITRQFAEAIATMGLSGCIFDNGQKQLSSRGLGAGIVNGNSYEDFHLGSSIELGDLEIKGPDHCILMAIKQSLLTVSNFQLNALNKGLSREACIMPVIGCTGLIIVFGVSFVLSPSFPTYLPISKQLDLSDPVERQVALAFLFKAVQYVRVLEKHICDACTKPAKLVDIIALSTTEYHLKTITPQIFRNGIGMLHGMTDHMQVQPGIAHMIDVLNMVYASVDARDYAEYPLSIRTPDRSEGSSKYYELIYRNLRNYGYKIGAPNRITEEPVFNAYRNQLRKAVTAIHEAGVIHVDLYASNIMYRSSGVVDDDIKVDIKIIDWDCAHCLSEGKYAEEVKQRLEAYWGKNNAPFGIMHDMRYVDVYFKDIDSFQSKLWHDLASGIKSDVDKAYTELIKY